MKTHDSRPAPAAFPLVAPPSDGIEGDGRGARHRLAQMRRDFPPATYAAILEALQSDFTALHDRLPQVSGTELARQGHILTALAGELEEDWLSARGRQLELAPGPEGLDETRAMIAALLELLAAEART